MGKTTKIVLVVPAEKMRCELEISHAERLLKMRNNGGWQIDEKSKFEFSVDYGIRVKPNKKEHTGAQKPERDK